MTMTISNLFHEHRLQTELIDTYIGQPKQESPADLHISPAVSSETIGFRDASFTWTNEDQSADNRRNARRFILRVEGELLFKPGQFNLIVGPTGSGKTSMLMALLGEHVRSLDK